MSERTRLSRAIDSLAEVIPNGELEVATDPAGFMSKVREALCSARLEAAEERLRSEKARRAGRAEGLRDAADILRNAAEADARSAVHCSAPNHRERLQNLSENELVMAQRMLARAEEVERE